MYTKIVPLKIPGSWAVIYNSFGDEEPIVLDGVIVNNEFYKQDLLSIERIQYSEKGWVTYPNSYIVDLGWYPDSDPKGSYHFTLLRGNWDNVVVQFESKDRQKIRAVIERCFALVMQGVKEQDISRWIELEYPSSQIN
ncbi:MAG: hypothetical protein V7K55_08230 [Nostoc sp.]|uniref:hypothetical protein n=1 Tax=Nostoc sp. TaxID=1180 RepID=UPI002FF603A8